MLRETAIGYFALQNETDRDLQNSWRKMDRLRRTTWRRRHYSSGRLHKTVVGIVVLDGRWCHEFVFHENRGWDGSLVEDIQADFNEICAIAFGKECN